MEALLELREVCKRYQDYEMRDVSFAVPGGSIVGLIGENGAGKTTLFKLILNQIKRDGGSIQVFGLDNIQEERRIKAELGMVFDDLPIYEGLLVKDVGRILEGIQPNWDKELYQGYLGRFRLPENKKIKELSRGMKKKLSIAAALAHRPRLLLLDEPTSGLDPVMRGEILDVFLDFIQDEEHSILLSSHITSDLERIADYIAFLHEGKLLFCQEKDALLDRCGVVKGSREQLAALAPGQAVGLRETAFGCSALVTDRERTSREHPQLTMDAASLDEIMTYYGMRGGERE